MSETGAYFGVRIPTVATLKKYGLSLAAWKRMVDRTRGRCPICNRKVRLVIDHEHTIGWKRMKPEERVKYVRGLPCILDNHYLLNQHATPEKLRAAADYLEDYERRRG